MILRSQHNSTLKKYLKIVFGEMAKKELISEEMVAKLNDFLTKLQK